MSERKHCWHHDGIVYDTYPSFHYETCCQCGKSRTVSAESRPEKHGPYLRGQAFERTETDVGPCITEAGATPTRELTDD